jgi:SPOR domain
LPSQTLADRPSLFRSGNGPTVDLSHLQMRTTTPAAPVAAEAPPVARQAAVPRWTPPADVPSRFAPPRGTDTGLADEFDAEDELPLADEPAVDDEFTLEDMSALPEYGDDAEIPPFPEDELAGLSRRRTNRGLFLIAGVLVVALAGGLAYVMLSDGKSTGTPPIIAADTTPTKVIPDPSAAAVDSAKESDRVEATDNASDTKLTTPGQVEIAAIPSATEPTNPISRVIIPGGPGFDAPTADDGTSDASGPGQIGPKKVRTVVVRPDGTIVSSEAAAPADAGAPPPAAVTPPAAEVTPPVAPTPPADVAATAPPPQTGMETVLDGQDGSIPVDTDPLSAGKPTKPEPGTVPASEAVKSPPAAAQVVAVESAKEPVPKPEVRPAKPVVVAAKAPMDIVPAAPAADTPRPAGAGALVQLSSQKSEDAARAAYQGLQRRYPSILGNYSPNIQRADLGDRGVYFRVRVGPFSGADATRLCEDLKAAGGDCIIAR